MTWQHGHDKAALPTRASDLAKPGHEVRTETAGTVCVCVLGEGVSAWLGGVDCVCEADPEAWMQHGTSGQAGGLGLTSGEEGSGVCGMRWPLSSHTGPPACEFPKERVALNLLKAEVPNAQWSHIT